MSIGIILALVKLDTIGLVSGFGKMDSEYRREVEMVEDEQLYNPALIQKIVTSKSTFRVLSWEERE